MTEKNWTYRPKSEKQIKSMYNTKKPMEFNEITDFHKWYNKTKKECRYCGLSEKESQEIIYKGLLTSKRFPYKGLTKRGVFRGYWLEIDKMDPKGPYSKDNCVLSCGFCNNDKSDVFSYDQYIEFREDRVGFLRRLLKK